MTERSEHITALTYAPLTGRALVRVAGEDARGFLQGLVSNDIDKVSATSAVYAALLTPQGKYLHDFFVVERDSALCLDCDGARIEDLLRRLRMYRLRAKVEIDVLEPAHRVYALIGGGALAAAGLSSQPGDCRGVEGGVVFTDPRLADAGARAILPEGDVAALEGFGFHAGTAADYDALRLRLGLPESGHDLVPDKSLLLECGFDELHGVDFEKGCYVGQEVTARMKHRNLVRKRILPVKIDGVAPPPGTPIVRTGVEVGELRSSHDGIGLAILRLDHVEAAQQEPDSPFSADGILLVPQKPDYLKI